MKFLLKALLLGLLPLGSVAIQAKNYQCLNYLKKASLGNAIALNSSSIVSQTLKPENSMGSNLEIDEDIIELPGRGHRFSLSQLQQMSEDNRQRVTVLKAGLSVLDRSEVVLALKAINQPLAYFTDRPDAIKIPDFLLSIVKNQVKAESVKDNFIFFKSYLPQDFSDSEIMGLSLIFADVKRPKKANPVVNFKPKSKIEKDNFINYLVLLLSRPHIANALLRFLKSDWIAFEANFAMQAEIARYEGLLHAQLKQESSVDRTIDFEASYISNYNRIVRTFNFDPEKLAEEYARKGKFSDVSMNIILAILDRYGELLLKYYEETAVKNTSLIQRLILNQKPPTIYELTRPQRLTIIENFLTDVADFKSLLGNLVDLFEHLFFGSAMPLKTEELEVMIRDSIKIWLLPVRNQVSLFKVEAHQKIQNAAMNAQLAAVEPIILSPLWGHSPIELPKTNANKRRNQTPNSQGRMSSSSNPVNTTSQNQEVIPDEINLANYSTFSQNPKPVQSLRDDVIYKFRFMRDDGEDAKIYSVEFASAVLKELNHSNEVAQLLLRALNLGFARTKHEDGLKILKAHKNGQMGRLYELKSRKSEVRLILQHINGHWKVLKYTDKNNFDRIVNDLITQL